MVGVVHFQDSSTNDPARVGEWYGDADIASALTTHIVVIGDVRAAGELEDFLAARGDPMSAVGIGPRKRAPADHFGGDRLEPLPVLRSVAIEVIPVFGMPLVQNMFVSHSRYPDRPMVLTHGQGYEIRFPLEGSSSDVATPTTGPHSKLADITLPAGSTGGGSGSPSDTYGIQNAFWQVPTAYDYTVQYLRQQLPIFNNYEAMRWCAEDVHREAEITQWSWGDTREMLLIAVNRDAADVSLSVSRGVSGHVFPQV
jgi:hypothetical protein